MKPSPAVRPAVIAVADAASTLHRASAGWADPRSPFKKAAASSAPAVVAGAAVASRRASSADAAPSTAASPAGESSVNCNSTPRPHARANASRAEVRASAGSGVVTSAPIADVRLVETAWIAVVLAAARANKSATSRSSTVLLRGRSR